MLLVNQIFDRQKISKFISLLMIMSLSINLTSCNFLTASNLFNSKLPTAINAIAEKYTSRRANTKKHKPIYITGKVIKIAPLLGKNAYQVQDDTGKIWVITTAKLPSIGQKIFIKCNIKSQNSSSKSQDLEKIYLVELEKLVNP